MTLRYIATHKRNKEYKYIGFYDSTLSQKSLFLSKEEEDHKNYIVLYHCQKKDNGKNTLWFSFRYFRVDLFDWQMITD
jgi:hypothetical protein